MDWFGLWQEYKVPFLTTAFSGFGLSLIGYFIKQKKRESKERSKQKASGNESPNIQHSGKGNIQVSSGGNTQYTTSYNGPVFNHQGQTVNGPQHNAAGDIHITGYTIEQHHQILTEEKEQLRKELEALHGVQTENLQLKKSLLEKELVEVESRLANIETSYQDRIQFLENTIKELRTIQGDVDGTLLAEAEAALKQGDTSKADELLAQIEEQEKSSIERAAKAAFERGKIAEANIDYRKALNHFTRAVELSPKYADYNNALAKILYVFGQYDSAIEYYQKALAIALNTHGEGQAQVVTYLSNLGAACKALGYYNKAIEYYQQALTVVGNSYREYSVNVAKEFKYKGDDYRAINQENYAPSSYTESIAIMCNLGEAFRFKGAQTESMNCLFEALMLQIRVSIPDEALTLEFRKISSDDELLVTILNNMGLTLLDMKKYSLALHYFKMAISNISWRDIRPIVNVIKNNIALAYIYLSKYDEAKKYIEEAIQGDESLFGEMHPSVARGFNNLGLLYKNTGEFFKAIKYYRKAIDINKRFFTCPNMAMSSTFFNLGALYFQQGNKKRAKYYTSLAAKQDKVIFGVNSDQYLYDLKLLELIGS